MCTQPEYYGIWLSKCDTHMHIFFPGIWWTSVWRIQLSIETTPKHVRMGREGEGEREKEWERGREREVERERMLTKGSWWKQQNQCRSRGVQIAASISACPLLIQLAIQEGKNCYNSHQQPICEVVYGQLKLYSSHSVAPGLHWKTFFQQNFALHVNFLHSEHTCKEPHSWLYMQE